MVMPSDGRFNNLSLLTETVGNYWSEVYGGRELVYDYLRGSSLQERQLEQNTSEFFDSLGRHTCPVLHTDLWHVLDLVEVDGSSASLLEYGDGFVYGVQPTGVTYAYGSPSNFTWQFPISDEIKEGYLLTDGMVRSTVMFAHGIDFFLLPESSKLVLATNPFYNSRLTPYLDDAGNRRIRLYLYRAGLDWQFMPKLYGSVLKLPGKSSNNYKRLVNAVLDSTVAGTAINDLAEVLSAITDVPRVVATGEVVQVITNDAAGKLVITDQNVYRFQLNATVMVEVGDTLTAGDFLIDAVQLFEPNQGEVPACITQMSVGKGLMLPALGSELIFENTDVPLIVEENVSGYTKVSFKLGGFSTDVTAFFAELHTRGVTNTATLANYLDIRENPTTEPNASNLPATINPLKFLFQNVLRYNTYVVYIRVRDFGVNALGFDNVLLLRKMLSPHTAVIIFTELEMPEEGITMEDDGNDSSPGVIESYETFLV